MAMATRWFVCLGGEATARYGLPGILLCLLGAGWIRRSSTLTPGSTSTVATAPYKASPEDVVQTFDDCRCLAKTVNTYRQSLALLTSALLWRDPALSQRLMYYLITSYPLYLALTYFVPIRYLILAAGTMFLTFNAPWSITLRRVMMRSLVVRYLLRLLLVVLGGGRGLGKEWARGEKGRHIFQSDPSAIASGAPQLGEDAVYIFTIYENQRWWLGLDFTSALLPNERPSWCVSYYLKLLARVIDSPCG